MVGWTDSQQKPDAARYLRLIAPETVSTANGEVANGANAAEQGVLNDAASDSDLGLPYPFFLAHPLQAEPQTLGDTHHWQIEWKWDGIRAQLVKRAGRVWLWSRGEDLITARFPEVTALGDALPDGFVLDGEILAWEPDALAPLPFARLQPRIARKTLTKKILADSPATFLAYDLLEANGNDLRMTPLAERRAQLEALAVSLDGTLARDLLRVSPRVEAPDWATLARLREESRARGVEGLMLKERQSMYGVGRTKASGTWWKWKIDPYAVDAVLVYAQRGHGRRASLYTDFTFAVWDEADGVRTLVPFAKAYSGLTDEEMRQVDAIVRKTTIEKFGPVRSVTPTLVFEIGFEGIQASPRHKSGIAVRFPRMLRWRTDKRIEEADSLAMLKGFIDNRPA
jgi:DNA ligase-1